MRMLQRRWSDLKFLRLWMLHSEEPHSSEPCDLAEVYEIERVRL